jgi:hypothetical protein
MQKPSPEVPPAAFDLIFLISSFRGFNTGIGGHYRSVREIAKLLGETNRIKIITYGNVPSPVFSGDINYRHVEAVSVFSPSGISRVRHSLREVALDQPQSRTLLISVGWIASYVAASLASIGIPLVRLHLRPGGEAAKFPRLLNGVPIAVFHQKDYDVFQALDASRALALVPGRVTRPVRDAGYLLNASRPFSDPGKIHTLCIMRIASDKRKPTAMIYDALARLNSAVIPAQMTFTHCGTVQDDDLYAELKNRKLGFDSAFVTDDFTTAAAPKYLHGHDAFIGIGRGVIEAMSLGIPAFIPVMDKAHDKHLCAVTKDNWREFLRENFTHRADYGALAGCGELIELDGFLAVPSLRDRLGRDAASIYEEHLSPAASLKTWTRFLHADHRSPSLSGDLLRAAYLVWLEAKRFLLIMIKRGKK